MIALGEPRSLLVDLIPYYTEIMTLVVAVFPILAALFALFVYRNHRRTRER